MLIDVFAEGGRLPLFYLTSASGENGPLLTYVHFITSFANNCLSILTVHTNVALRAKSNTIFIVVLRMTRRKELRDINWSAVW